MSIELTKSDFIPKANVTIQDLSKSGELAKAVQENGANLKDLVEFGKIVESILGRVQDIQSKKSGQQTINSPPINVTPQNPQIQIVERQIDEKKLSDGFKNLLVETAPKMPEEFKDLKIRDIIGENFKTLKIKVMGMDATGDQLVDIFVAQLIEQIKRCYK